MIAAALLIFLGASLLGLAAWVVILPPRADYSGDDFELSNLRTEGRSGDAADGR